MEKTIFKNRKFYTLLIVYILLLMVFNLYATITGNVYGIIPIIVQGVLLYLIISGNSYARMIILIWAIGFLLFPDGVQVCDSISGVFESEPKSISVYPIILNLIRVAIDILIIDHTRRTTAVTYIPLEP
jgi:hypothetical protein